MSGPPMKGPYDPDRIRERVAAASMTSDPTTDRHREAREALDDAITSFRDAERAWRTHQSESRGHRSYILDHSDVPSDALAAVRAMTWEAAAVDLEARRAALASPADSLDEARLAKALSEAEGWPLTAAKLVATRVAREYALTAALSEEPR